MKSNHSQIPPRPIKSGSYPTTRGAANAHSSYSTRGKCEEPTLLQLAIIFVNYAIKR